MTRGNQRDHDRERAAKKNAGKPKNTDSASATLAKKESNAEIMRAKQEKANQKAAAAAAEAGGTKNTSGIVKIK